MPWDALVDSQILAIHAALVPTDNGDGEIIYFGGDQHDQTQNNTNVIDASRRYNCRTGAITYVRSPTTDVFCAGQASLADGRLLVAGGTSIWTSEGGGIHHGHFKGHRRAWVYNPSSSSFSEVAPMRPEPGRDETDSGGGRWYPTLVTLLTGQVLAVSGHPLTGDGRHYNNTPERYLPATNSWTRLPAFGSAGIENYYPRLHLLPNGEVFISSDIAQRTANVSYNPWTGAATDICPLPNGRYHGFSAPSILLPLLPGEGYKARVLLCGGEIPQRINLQPAAGTPAWVPTRNAPADGGRTGSAIGKLRLHSCAVILPTGRILLTGGVAQDNPTDNGVREPELYDPAITWGASGSGGQYRDDDSDGWTTIEEAAGEVRNYHSTALLMPDGNVWNAGSSRQGQPGHPANSVLQIQVFRPPYAAGARPIISACPSNIAYNQTFDVQSPQADTIQRVALIRCGSVTHAFDSDQRYVSLQFTRDGNTLRLTAPAHGGIAPPGYYMLFLVDSSDRPCERARFVRVGGQINIITNRSTFSQVEVQAQASLPARFFDSFYFIMDGYLPGEVGLPTGPDVSFVWADGGGTVPGMAAELSDTLFEDDSAPAGVAQRIALLYTIRFDNETAFSMLGVPEQRAVTVIVRRGSHEARASLTLFRRANPFMRDGDTPWLSIDLRVIQRTPGMSLAGVTQGSGANAPFNFIQGVLAAFHTRPEDADHPFITRLEQTQEDSKLQLASEVGDQPVYNYAFAKVRFKAPAGVTADNVRVFFRSFTTAATSLEYNTATVYRRQGNGASAAPLLGLVGGAIASIPFFASERVANMELQTDPLNIKPITGSGATEKTAYFGCWLDFNQDTPRFPDAPVGSGPFAGPLKSVKQHIRGRHQCLVAEIHFTDAPVTYGATPADSDKLAQRNLIILGSDNPGNAASHIVQHTFELRPSQGGGFGGVEPGLTVALPAASRQGGPDELLIRWYDLPRESIATLYIPGVAADELLEMAALRPGPGMLRRIDEHTIQCRIGDISYIPLPASRGGTNIPGLLSIQLPPTVRQGTTYKVSAHQVSGFDRKIIGSFQLTIPVSRGDLLLESEERDFSVLRYIAQSIPTGDRWHPVFTRYLEQIADRIRGFGGNPDEIEPSPSGTGRPTGKPWGECRIRWLFPAILAALLVVIAVTPIVWAAPVSAFGIVLLLAVACWWYVKCKPRRCDLLSHALLGIGVASAVLGVIALLGFTSAGLIVMLAVLGILAGLLVIVSLLLKCCFKC